jgi:hypothetical protein
VNADVYKQGAERMAAIASCLNTVLIAIRLLRELRL